MRRLSDRLIGSAAAIALQAGFLLLLLQSVHILTPPAKLAQEMTLFLPRPRPQPVQQAAPRAATPPIVQTIPDITLPPPPNGAVPSTADVQGLGRALFGCAPEAYANLPPEERAHCPKPGNSLALQRAPDIYGAPSHAKDEAHWAAELAREKSAPWLPCTEVITTITRGSLHAFDLKCLAPLFTSGAIADPHSWQVYDTGAMAPEDLYKLRQAYDAWHRKHDPGKASANSPPRPSAGTALPGK
ncbi:MAG TPA: hypothetical protein VFQ52_09120 [Rhizomicrobium sp.]|nr:hypothetical protein [Rhizomicrobium sp.]